MKTISKVITAGVLAFTSVSLTVAPASAVGESAACTALATLQTKSMTAISTRTANMNTDFIKRISNINNRVATVDPKVDAARDKAAEKFDAAIAKLNATEGLTADQKKAIETFQTQMRAAETAREDAVDAARTTYRQSLVNVVQQHQTALSTAATTYQAAAAEAFATAVANCSSGTAKTVLKASIAGARATFAKARQSAKVGTQIKQLAQVRNDAVKAANEDFTQKVATYTATLSSVLGNK